MSNDGWGDALNNSQSKLGDAYAGRRQGPSFNGLAVGGIAGGGFIGNRRQRAIHLASILPEDPKEAMALFEEAMKVVTALYPWSERSSIGDIDRKGEKIVGQDPRQPVETTGQDFGDSKA